MEAAEVQSAHQTFFPTVLPGGVTARLLEQDASQLVALAVLLQIFPGIESMHFRTPLERQAQGSRLRDLFHRPNPLYAGFFDQDDKPVGWYYGYMEDENTHHIDTIGLLAEVRGKGIYSAFLSELIGYLREQRFERVSVYHHPNNRAVMIAELKAGFSIVGMELHEEIGPNIKMVYFMHDDRRAGFERLFSIMPDTSQR